MPILNKSKFEQLTFPLAPLPEQKRIVAKIEELFTQLDAGAAALKRVRAGLKRYKASVLKAAVEGRLTFETQNIVDLKAWEYKQLSKVVVSLGQGWSPQCEKGPSPSENDWGVLKTTAIQAGYYLEMENKCLPKHLEPRAQHEVKKGDIIITCAGPRNRCGIACLVKKTRKKL